MDFLDSFDLDVSKYKKSRRVRSWYLYEQFKSLERNQLDAARKLKNRSYQDKILRQELSERKARRKLYDQYGLTQSESGIERSLKSDSTKTSLNVSTDDFFESFHELQEDEGGVEQMVAQDILDSFDPDNSQAGKYYDDDFKSADEPNANEPVFTAISAESINSVVNVKSKETLTDDIRKYLAIEKETKFDDIELNFDEVKEKLQCLERLTQMRDYDNKFTENEDSLYSVEDDEMKQITMKDKNVNTPDNNIYFMWSKLVSFAYQIMQLNHGNCYYDYGSQFLTAVLACDVLRRGINRMCRILQHYVSPIKFATDSESAVDTHKNSKRINPQRSRQSRTHSYKRYYPHHNLTKSRMKLHPPSRKYWSENFWEKSSTPFFIDNKTISKKYRPSSEPGQSITLSMNKRIANSKSSYRSIWPFFSSDIFRKKCLYVETCTCCCHKVVNPMLRLTRYLDRIMCDIDDPFLI